MSSPLLAVARGDTDYGITFVDISNTWDMTILSQFKDPDVDPEIPLFIDDTTLYVLGWMNGDQYNGKRALMVLDVTDPRNATVVASYTEVDDPDFMPYEMKRVGDRLYVASLYGFDGGGLFIFDISVPTSPQVLGSYVDMTPSPTGTIAPMQQFASPIRITPTLVLGVAGNIGGRLTVIDVSDEANPTLAHTKDWPVDTFWEFDVVDLTLVRPGLVAGATWDYGSGIALFDVSDPADMQWLGTYNPGFNLHYSSSDFRIVFTRTDGKVVAMDSSERTGGLLLLDLTNELAPQVLARTRGDIAFPPISLSMGWNDSMFVQDNWNRGAKIAAFDRDFNHIGSIEDIRCSFGVVAVNQVPFTSVPVGGDDATADSFPPPANVDSILVRRAGGRTIDMGSTTATARFTGHRPASVVHDGYHG